MISVQEALRLVLAELPLVDAEYVMLGEAHARVLAAPIVATRDIPPFRNSAMDGYAVRSADLGRAPRRLRVLEVVGAGATPSQPVRAGTATKIMTGSPLPPEADAVVKVEDTVGDGDAVEIRAPVPPGANVREPGEDMRAGEVVLQPGRMLRAADIGMLASLGIVSVAVRRRPRVSIVATGDELVDVGQPLGPGQIVNSNAYTLAAAVREAGGEPVLMGIARDQPETLRVAFEAAFRADMVLSTGGVSVGSFDYVRQVQADLGVCERFWRVAQKPGKPMSFGLREATPVFGLPGNPVSTLVCFYVYVLPAIRALMGADRRYLPALTAQAAEDIRKVEALTEFVRCELATAGDGHVVRPTGSQSSGVLRSMSAGDVLVIGPPGTAVLHRGTPVRAIVLDPGSGAATAPF
jgi:molybdopterin molybdotransferase